MPNVWLTPAGYWAGFPLPCGPFSKSRAARDAEGGRSGVRARNFVRLLSVHDLFHAAHHACEAEGFVCLCDDSTDGWPIEKAADYLLAQLATQKKANPHRRVAVLADGELSSPVTGDGIGGRNAAFVLALRAEDCGKGHHSAERGDGWNRRK